MSLSYKRWKKSKLQAYLDDREIPYNEDDTNKELRALISEVWESEPPVSQGRYEVLKNWKCELAGRIIDVVKGEKIDLNDWEFEKLHGVGVV